MAPVNINVPGIKSAMENVHTCLEDTFTQIKKMNEALDTVVNAHKSTNAQTIQQDAAAIERDLREAFAAMKQTHSDVYEKGNALLVKAGQPTIPEPASPELGPERSPGSYNDEDIVYDPQALEHYQEAHATAQQAGTIVAEINDLFQNKIPVAFDSQASASIVAHHQVINGNFEEAHQGMLKLLGDTAPGEVDELFALDRQLSG
ncbi:MULTISPECIES: hypothetical protein [Mycobacteroides]|uniref:Uncharacterized protein n=1 Tax=Mycobacteroides salmoniphilum TaxID=404941 RepID=A0A4R8SUX4_9MYCO|nr:MULTISPECIES: hypothetical protein [Mycobacteroides]TEA06109.1 hypothetical protein CCUG60884_01246 [Mycobacteroides salmoniphilum]